MVTFNEAVESSARSGLCFLLGQFDEAAKFLVRVVGTSAGVAPVASGIRRKLCSDDPANDPVYEPPFSGGQCPVDYNATWEQRTFNSGTMTYNWTPRSATGGDRRGPMGITDPSLGGGCSPGTQEARETIVPAVGASFLVGFGGCSDVKPSYRNLVFTRQDGLPDDCGDIPPVLPEPGPIIYEGDDITYNIDESTDITVPISFVFSPVYVDLDGSLKIPVNFDVGGVTFDGTIEVSPEFNFEFNPSGIDGGPGTVDDPDGIGEPGEPSDPVEDPEEGTLPIIGVLVYSDIDPDGDPSGILFPTGPNIYVPRLASVTFAVQTANSIGWTPDQDVKNLECYVPCPALQGAIAVRVSPMRGVTSRFTPVRGRLLTPGT